MRIAYLILAHQLPDQLVRLVQRPDSAGALFLIHINCRSDDAIFRTAQAGLAELDNVVFLRRHKLYWGAFGHVRATIEGLDELYRRTAQFDYVALTTGQDYPIKPIPATIVAVAEGLLRYGRERGLSDEEAARSWARPLGIRALRGGCGARARGTLSTLDEFYGPLPAGGARVAGDTLVVRRGCGVPR